MPMPSGIAAKMGRSSGSPGLPSEFVVTMSHHNAKHGYGHHQACDDEPDARPLFVSGGSTLHWTSSSGPLSGPLRVTCTC
jgi:hypothetical protein